MKMRYYYSNEQDKILSMDDIRNEYEQFRKEGQYTDMSFEYYLQGCMYWNNGDLTPVIDKVFSLRRKLDKLDKLSWQEGKLDRYGYIRTEPSNEYDEQITELKKQISELEKYL